MALSRRAGAPRLIDWTGERCVPWASDIAVVYEHFHRYLWAARLVGGKRVLDLGSGEGFGSAMLAEAASAVTGVDIDQASVDHSTLNYEAPNLTFRRGSALDLSTFEPASFDAVVAFEMIEHVSDQERVLAEIDRVLAPDGLLVISTPERRVYNHGTGQENPFHERELTLDEFVDLLAATFPHVACCGQRTMTGSRIDALDRRSARGEIASDAIPGEIASDGIPGEIASDAIPGGSAAGASSAGSAAGASSAGSAARASPGGSAARASSAGSAAARDGGDPADFFIGRLGDEWTMAARLSPLYLIAVASKVALPALPEASTLADFDLTLMRQSERAAVLARAETQQLAEEAEAARAAAEAQRASAAAEGLARSGEVAAIAAELDQARRNLTGELGEMAAATQVQLEQRDVEVAAARLAAEQLRARLGAEEEERESLRKRLLRTEESVTWRAFQVARTRLYAAIGGQGSTVARLLSWWLRLFGRLALRSQPPAPATETPAAFERGPSIRFPQFADPKVSLLIAIHARADLSEKCLESIRNHTIGVSYEVILLDDAADAESKLLLERVDGARKIVNETNLGFLRTINRGAEEARGKWFVVMNNDTEVTYGWLSAMLDCGESASDVGVVTPKYVYPDGRLQEAGGLVWRDATGANVGRDESPETCLYNYRRETDYGSGAALMVRASFWREVGGFDERFLPMYYEDTDLCFQARERGLRVLYEPRAVVIHFEGATAGTDANPRQKRYQELNRPKFVSKWRHRLERDHLRPDVTNVRLATDRHPGPHVLIVDHRVVTWDRDSGSQRMLGIIRGFLAEGLHVTFLPNNLAPIQPYTRELQRLGVAVLYGDIALRAELATIGPRLRLVVLSRPHAASAWVDTFRELAPAARLVYDTVDLHWLREARRAGVSPDSATLPAKAAALRELELALIRATDETWVVTEGEAAQVIADVPGTRTRLVPNVHEIEQHVPPAESRFGILFVGGFEHTPNVDAAIRLVREVMPLVWAELGDVRVVIVGPDPPPEVRLLASPLVDVTGWVDDLKPLLRLSRLLVAPLNYGAGLKGKVTQALAAGLPVVTTPIGAEGFDLVDDGQILVGTTSEEIARHVVRAYRDDGLWQQLSEAGQDLVARHCSVEVVGEQLRGALEDSEGSVRARVSAGHR